MSRQSAQTIADLNISVTRVKRHLQNYGVNEVLQRQIDEIDTKLEEFKKSGAPAVTAPRPQRLPKNSDLEAKTQRSKEAEVFNVQTQAYRAYASDNYVSLKNASVVYFQLASLLSLLKSKQTPSVAKTLKEESDAFSAPLTKRVKESQEQFARRSAARAAVLAKLGHVALGDTAALQASMKSIESSYPGMDLFIKRNELSGERARINEAAVVAVSAVIENVLKELALHCMQNVVDNNKAKILVDHCVSEDIATKPLYPLYRNLPTYVNVLSRKERREIYDGDKHLSDEVRNERAKAYHAKHKAKGERFVKPPSVFPTFGEQEVKEGHAVALPAKVVASNEGDASKDTNAKDTNTKTPKTPKVKYQWYGIDIANEDVDAYAEDQFDNYITNIVDSVKAFDKLLYDSVRVSSELRHFFSNLAIDLIKKYAPVLKDVVEFAGHKTINLESVVLGTRILLFGGQPVAGKYGELSEKYEELFGTITKSTDRINTHRATARENKSATASAASEVATQAAQFQAAVKEEPTGEAVPAPTARAAAAPTKTAPPVQKGKEIRRPVQK